MLAVYGDEYYKEGDQGDHHLLFLERFILGTTMINRNTFLGYKNLNGTNIPASLNLTSNESQLFLTCVHSTQWH